jgi:hypothetical protein
MPNGTYEHPLLGSVAFKTKSSTWVRGDGITFTSGFDPATEVKEIYIPQLKTVKGANKGRFPFHVRGHAQLISAFEEVERRNLLSHIVEFGGGFEPRLRKPTDGSLSKLPSNHAFGLAIDINPNDGSNGGTAAPLEPVFTLHGFLWGQAFHDPMHFEVRAFQPFADMWLDPPVHDAQHGGRSLTVMPRFAELSDFIAQQARHFPAGLRRLEVQLEANGSLSFELEGAEAANGAPGVMTTLFAGTPLTYARIVELVEANNKCSAVSTELLTALIWKESNFNPEAVNPAPGNTATGLMMITEDAVDDVNANMPVGIHFDHSSMTDAEKNIQCGTYYLGLRIKRAGNDVTKGLDRFGTGTGYSKNLFACEKCLKAGPADPQTCLNVIHT